MLSNPWFVVRCSSFVVRCLSPGDGELGSLIVIIGLFDLLNIARPAAQDPDWLGFYTEAFVFVGAIYSLGSVALSRNGLWLERRMASAHRAVRAPQLQQPQLLERNSEPRQPDRDR